MVDGQWFNVPVVVDDVMEQCREESDAIIIILCGWMDGWICERKRSGV